ncbi:hypothetical protein AB7M45_004540 [Bradyrhizobium elkanii]
MRPPGAEQLLGVIDRQRVGISAGAVAPGSEHVVEAVMPRDGRVGEFEPGQQRALPFPLVGKADAFVDRDIPMRGAFRNHPQFAVVLDQERVGQVPGFLEHRQHGADRSVAVEFDRGDDALAGAVVEVLEEHEGPALPLHRDGIGIEVIAGIAEHVPGRSRQVAGPPDIRVVGVAPTDMPMRRVAAETVDFLRDRGRDAAQDKGHGISRRAAGRRHSQLRDQPRSARQDRRQHGQGARHHRFEPAAQAGGDFR